LPNALAFGSAHVNGFNMVFCDGAVRTVSYNISTLVHQNLASRNDGQSVDVTDLGD
jgi:prepilin-type processing-associated H-X9-DG protein